MIVLIVVEVMVAVVVLVTAAVLVTASVVVIYISGSRMVVGHCGFGGGKVVWWLR